MHLNTLSRLATLSAAFADQYLMFSVGRQF
jgi:hypothetical protein